MLKSVIAGVSVVVLFVMLYFGLMISARNQEVRLRNAFVAQEKNNESSFDKTWKIIQQNAEVAGEERESFRKTYVEIMTAQQGVAGNGSLASFFKQAKVDVSGALFSKLMTTIEAQRESFHRDQQKLIQIANNHKNILHTFPTSFFLSDKEDIVVNIVTSARTNEVFQTHGDNSVDLFKKDK